MGETRYSMDKFKVSTEKQDGTEEHNNAHGGAKINLLTRSTTTGDPYPKGDGATYPKTGDSLVCHYEMYDRQNQMFDCSKSRCMAYSFVCGSDQVIPGWDMAVRQMSKGQKAEVEVPAKLAFDTRWYRSAREAGIGAPQDEQIRMFIELVDINEPLFVTNCRRKAEQAELERCEAMEAEMLRMAKAGVQPKAAANGGLTFGGLQSSKVPAKKRKQREESSSSSSSSDSEERRKKKKKKDKSKAKHKKEKKKKKKKDKKEKKERK